MEFVLDLFFFDDDLLLELEILVARAYMRCYHYKNVYRRLLLYFPKRASYRDREYCIKCGVHQTQMKKLLHLISSKWNSR